MKQFILGYANADIDVTDEGENLTVYATMEEANYESEEWCTVEAENEAEARLKYESAFEDHKENGRIGGPF